MPTTLNWPKQSTRYCEGLDDSGHILPEVAYELLQDQGHVVQLGQVGPFVERMLNRLVKQGALVKYRGHWDTGLPSVGMGPLKTIWALPATFKQAQELDAGITACLSRKAA